MAKKGIFERFINQFRWQRPVTSPSSSSSAAATNTIVPTLTGTTANNSNNGSVTNQGTQGGANSYLSDRDITDEGRDEFGRQQFATRIAESIASRSEESSIVFGLYGEWGQGKTTVLNFIRKKLENNQGIILINFNPWMFQNEEGLLKDFFQTVADKLQVPLHSGVEKAGKFVEQWGGATAPFSGLLPGLDKVADFGKAISSVQLEVLKERVDIILKSTDKRVVIVMDDIDRLEKGEIHAVFRLVKLTGDFKRTTYLLSFDKEMVAAALSERFTSKSDRNPGMSFLEKIVQIPLELPKVREADLTDFCFKIVDSCLNNAGVQLTTEQAHSYARYFRAFQHRLRTPRVAKRYGNALSFSLPLVKGEVDTHDFIFIEGLRVFWPEAYDFIYSHQELFVGHADNTLERRKEEYKAELGTFLEPFTKAEKDALSELLIILFPRTAAILRNTYYGAEAEGEWKKQKKVCSPYYFQRYFVYGVPLGDISDISIDNLLAELKNKTIQEVNSTLKTMADMGGGILINKLREKVAGLDPECAKILSMSIAPLISNLRDTKSFIPFQSPYFQGIYLLIDLIRVIPIEHERAELIKEIISQDTSAYMIATLVDQVWRDNTQSNSGIPMFQDQNLMAHVLHLAADHFRKIGRHTVFVANQTDKNEAFYVLWARITSQTETEENILRIAKTDPDWAEKLLLQFSSTTWDLESGLPTSGSFSAENYGRLILVIRPNIIYKHLVKKYGDSLKIGNFLDAVGKGGALGLARQFAFVYTNRKKKAARLSGQRINITSARRVRLKIPGK